MLVLTRKVEERLQIGPDITITIVKVENGKVRIGISAPQVYEITRPDAKNKTKQSKSVKAH